MIRLALMAALAVLPLSLNARQPAPAQENAPAARPSFDEWLQGFRATAIEAGVTPATVNDALSGLRPLEVVVERDRTQTEIVLTLEQYVERRLPRSFVRTAVQRARDHRTLLQRIGRTYEVQPRFLVAVWGLESNFGRFSGVRPTVQALATLAWDGRREALFRRELLDALRILDKGYIGLAAMKGSWAGAMGQPQFMPSSYLQYAEDFDGDGLRDIWKSEGDVLASIANYLKQHGWKDGETWGREVRLPAGGADALFGRVGRREQGCRAEREMSVKLPLAKWQALGVRSIDGRALPTADREASLVAGSRRAFLVYGNYESLLEYNCAHAYALAVSLLADRIGG